MKKWNNLKKVLTILALLGLLGCVFLPVPALAVELSGQNAPDSNISGIVSLIQANPVTTLCLIIAFFALLTAIIFNVYNSKRRQLEKEKNDELQKALQLAEQASAAKGEFMSRMSHEIRTPLNALIGYNTLAKNAVTGARTDEERRQADMNVMDCLTKSELASRHLLTVINDVLDMSAIESGKIKVMSERFDFKNLINSLTVLFYSQASVKNVDFEVLFDSPTEEWFLGDQLRISQILTNLLSNAVKFTPEGGSVKMNIVTQAVDERQMNFHFEISDTGIGMDQDFLDHLWTPFEQADSSISRRFGGTGLGLSIAKSLVDIMNGTITAQSTKGVGSTFSVDLTLQRTGQPVKNKVYDFSGIKALVVDDDAGTCDYIRLLFDRCGVRCQTVTSGAAALTAYQQAIALNERFTLCLIDWRMPQMDGLETVKRLRAISGEDIPLIIVTAYDFSEIADRVRDAGVTMFVSKPLFHSTLFDLLANICGAEETTADSVESAGCSASAASSDSGDSVDKGRNAVADFKGARIMLAEDNRMNMEVAKRILEAADLRVDCAWNGREAVAMFEAAPAETYKVILMDVHMPEMNGHQATRAIRALEQSDAAAIPIIAMTADVFAENVTAAYAAGMTDYVAKPIDIQALFGVLRKYL